MEEMVERVREATQSAEWGAELDLLRLSMTLAHNRGDLTQGMGFWRRTPLTAPVMGHLSAHGPMRKLIGVPRVSFASIARARP